MTWSPELLQYVAGGILWVLSVLGAIRAGQTVKQKNTGAARLEGFAAAVNEVYADNPVAKQLERIANVLERREAIDKDEFQKKMEEIFDRMDFAEQIAVMQGVRNKTGT